MGSRKEDALARGRPALIHALFEFSEILLGGSNLVWVTRCVLLSPNRKQVQRGPIDRAIR